MRSLNWPHKYREMSKPDPRYYIYYGYSKKRRNVQKSKDYANRDIPHEGVTLYTILLQYCINEMTQTSNSSVHDIHWLMSDDSALTSAQGLHYPRYAPIRLVYLRGHCGYCFTHALQAPFQTCTPIVLLACLPFIFGLLCLLSCSRLLSGLREWVISFHYSMLRK